MFNILTHKINENENELRFSLIPVRVAISRKQTSAGEDVGEMETLFTMVGM
jgi:hypothetical protein